MNDKTLRKMIGVQRNPFGRLVRDSDGDGVMNAVDCQPNNPKKQGWIHSLAASVSRKLGNEEGAQKWEQKGRIYDKEKKEEKTAMNIQRYEKEDIAAEARAGAMEERRRQMVETAKFREKTRGEEQRASIKKRKESGGVLGQFMSGLGKISRPTAARRISEYNPNLISEYNPNLFGKQKRNKRKRSKRKAERTPQKPKTQKLFKPFSISEFKSGIKI